MLQILVGKSEGKKLLGRPEHRQENNVKMHLKKLGMSVDCIHLVQDRI
jgi:hypothetical protein